MAKAKDGAVTTPLLWVLALYGLWRSLKSNDEPGRYDFSKYKDLMK
jgi:hypothetical protein